MKLWAIYNFVHLIVTQNVDKIKESVSSEYVNVYFHVIRNHQRTGGWIVRPKGERRFEYDKPISGVCQMQLTSSPSFVLL